MADQDDEDSRLAAAPVAAKAANNPSAEHAGALPFSVASRAIRSAFGLAKAPGEDDQTFLRTDAFANAGTSWRSG